MRRDSAALEQGTEGEAEPAPPQYRLAVLQAHPRFAEAMRLCARNSVELYNRGRVMGWLLSDRMLAIVAFAAVCLDADVRPDDLRSGLTPGRFKAFCVQKGICSEGRAAAVLAFLRLSGHVESEAHPADRRITRLRPSAKLLDVVLIRLRSQLDAASLIVPEIAPAAPRLDEPDFQRQFFLAMLHRYNSGIRLLAYAPQLRLFAERDVGVLILLDLMLQADPADPVPTAGEMPLSIAALARRFRVSRTHVLRLIRDGEAAGLIARVGEKGNRIVFSEPLRRDLRNLIGGMFQHVVVCASTVLGSDEAVADAR